MDTDNILEQILKSGKQMLLHGQEFAEDGLNMSEHDFEHDAMLLGLGLGNGALITGGLAALLGTRAGRRLTGGTLKLGGLAAIGGRAHQVYHKWQQENSEQIVLSPRVDGKALNGNASMERSRLLVKTMVAAAKADGQINIKERLIINMQSCELGLDDGSATFIACELEKPLDANDIAAKVNSPETAAEIYLVSKAIIDIDNKNERSYLQELERALDLPGELVAELNKNIA